MYVFKYINNNYPDNFIMFRIMKLILEVITHIYIYIST